MYTVKMCRLDQIVTKEDSKKLSVAKALPKYFYDCKGTLENGTGDVYSRKPNGTFYKLSKSAGGYIIGGKSFALSKIKVRYESVKNKASHVFVDENLFCGSDIIDSEKTVEIQNDDFEGYLASVSGKAIYEKVFTNKDDVELFIGDLSNIGHSLSVKVCAMG